MPLVIPPGFGQATYIFTGEPGTPIFATTLGLDISAHGGDHVQAANNAYEAFQTTLLPRTSNALTLDRVSLLVGGDGGSGSVDSTLGGSQGGSTGEFAPVAEAYIARKNTNILGRRGKGRMFLPGSASENSVDESGRLSVGEVSAVNAALQDFHDTLNDVPYEIPPVLFHSQAPADPTPIVSFTVAPVVGWIRKRIR